MTGLEIFKKSVAFVSSVGISCIVSDVVANNVMKDTTIRKVAVPVGSYALYSCIATAVEEHTNEQIDIIAHNLSILKQKFKDAQAAK